MQTLIIHELGFHHNYLSFTLILLNIVLCGRFPCNKFINYKCFDMRMRPYVALDTLVEQVITESVLLIVID